MTGPQMGLLAVAIYGGLVLIAVVVLYRFVKREERRLQRHDDQQRYEHALVAFEHRHTEGQ